MSSASAYGYVCTQDLEVRWHIGAFALLSGNEYLEVFCHRDQLHFALLVLVYPDSALFHCGSVAWANPNDIVSRGRSKPRRIGKMPHLNIKLRVAPVFFFLDFYNPAAAGTLLLALMGYSLEADHGHMASSETITSKAFISPPTNVLSVATPM